MFSVNLRKPWFVGTFLVTITAGNAWLKTSSTREMWDELNERPPNFRCKYVGLKACSLSGSKPHVGLKACSAWVGSHPCSSSSASANCLDSGWVYEHPSDDPSISSQELATIEAGNALLLHTLYVTAIVILSTRQYSALVVLREDIHLALYMWPACQ
jgi:hypothetical protein